MSDRSLFGWPAQRFPARRSFRDGHVHPTSHVFEGRTSVQDAVCAESALEARASRVSSVRPGSRAHVVEDLVAEALARDEHREPRRVGGLAHGVSGLTPNVASAWCDRLAVTAFKYRPAGCLRPCPHAVRCTEYWLLGQDGHSLDVIGGSRISMRDSRRVRKRRGQPPPSWRGGRAAVVRRIPGTDICRTFGQCAATACLNESGPPRTTGTLLPDCLTVKKPRLRRPHSDRCGMQYRGIGSKKSSRHRRRKFAIVGFDDRGIGDS